MLHISIPEGMSFTFSFWNPFSGRPKTPPHAGPPYCSLPKRWPLPLFRISCQLPPQSKHIVAFHDIIISLCLPLHVHVHINGTHLAQQIHTFHLHHQAVFQERTRKGGVPYQIVRIHGGFVIAPAAVHIQTGSCILPKGRSGNRKHPRC